MWGGRPRPPLSILTLILTLILIFVIQIVILASVIQLPGKPETILGQNQIQKRWARARPTLH
jgi:hypothetical protein